MAIGGSGGDLAFDGRSDADGVHAVVRGPASHLAPMNIARLVIYLVVGLLVAILLQSLAIWLFG
jgi:hypothetical protein